MFCLVNKYKKYLLTVLQDIKLELLNHDAVITAR